MKLSIAAIIKDEAASLLEWIAFHRIIGVHDFHIADNESSDGTSALLDDLERIGVAHRLPFRAPDDSAARVAAYAALLARARGQCDLIAFIEADEFLFPTDGARSILPLLERRFADAEVSAMGLNWMNFGSADALFAGDGLVIERFPRHAARAFGAHHRIKSVARPDRIAGFVNPHYLALTGGRYVHADGRDIENHPRHGRGATREISWEGARVNHYATKSLEEFLQGKSRRVGAGGRTHGGHKHYFQRHDRNEETCPLAGRFAAEVEREMARLRERIDCAEPAPTTKPTPRRSGFNLRRFLRAMVLAK